MMSNFVELNNVFHGVTLIHMVSWGCWGRLGKNDYIYLKCKRIQKYLNLNNIVLKFSIRKTERHMD